MQCGTVVMVVLVVLLFLIFICFGGQMMDDE